MLYVPDARGYTIEIIEGSAKKRMVENLRRWSGNMLRNGQRAIALGPTRMPFFIWWCCVDQRLAMWTMLFSPMLAIAGAIKLGTPFLISYFVYIAITRGLLAMILFTYAHRVDLNFIWALYVNQLVNAVVKVYMLWRLAKQKWANRGNQKAGFRRAWLGCPLARGHGGLADRAFICEPVSDCHDLHQARDHSELVVRPGYA